MFHVEHERIRRMVTHAVELRAEGEDKAPVLVGRGAVYDTETVVAGLFREKVAKGAFTDSIRKGDHDIYSTFNHDDSQLLGRRSANTLTLEDGDDGLTFRVRLNMDTQVGRDVAAMAKRGDLRGCSVQFQVRGQERGMPDYESADPRERMPLRTITRAELFEVGPVTDPQYESTSLEMRAADKRTADSLNAAPCASEQDVLELEAEVLALSASVEGSDAYQA